MFSAKGNLLRKAGISKDLCYIIQDGTDLWALTANIGRSAMERSR